MKVKPQKYAEIVLALTGIILVIDGLFLHLISFAYPEFIAWMDEWVGMFGVLFVLIAYIGWKSHG